VVFEKEYITRCSSAEWTECLEMMPSWCRQVNWGNCGIPWVNCAVLCVKDDWKGQGEACAIACQNCAVYSVFPSGMTSHSKIAQFNWEYRALNTPGSPLRPDRLILYQNSVSTWIWLSTLFCGSKIMQFSDEVSVLLFRVLTDPPNH
jgi:hypothetical protein